MKISNLRHAAAALRTEDEYRRLRSGATLAILISSSLIASIGLVFASIDNGARTRLANLTSLSVASLPAPAEGSRILARDGSELALLIGHEKRTVVPIEKISQVMIDATVAVEDRRFFSHRGIDLRGVARAARTDLRYGEIREGGSTITQQYVRNTYLETKQTFGRKVEEIGLALAVEQSHSKDEILEAYLNTAYFGEGVYGVEAASQFYFSTPADKLRPEQAATLVSVLPSPNEYSPVANPKLSLKQRNLVLEDMGQASVISKSDVEALKTTPLNLVPQSTLDIKMAPHFVELVKQTLLDDERLGKTAKARYDSVFRGGLTIKTSLEPKLQVVVDSAATKLPRGVPEAAIVVMDHANGDILGYHGGRDFAESKFDLASQARRQPGSAFKTFALVTALQQNYSPSLGLSGASPCVHRSNKFDAPWKVQNFANASFGEVSLRTATHNSINCAYAQLVTDYVKPRDVEETAHRMGITSKLHSYPSITLGAVDVSPLEMTRAYATLGAEGVRPKVRAILQVRDRDNKIVFTQKAESQQVMTANVARMATDILQGVVANGTGTRARFAWPAAGKTGTTQRNRDAWFVGYTPRLVGAVWVGHRKGAVRMNSVTGGTVCAGIWRNVMEAAHESLARKSFTKPNEKQFTRFYLDVNKKGRPSPSPSPSETPTPAPAPAPVTPSEPPPSTEPPPEQAPSPSGAPPPEPSPTT